VGRYNPTTDEKPEIDLTDYGAVEKGVSRRHAFIIRRDGSLYLVDNDSPNGTFLNGQKLVAQQPRVLRDGDDIRLGHLVLRITFQSG
jgi:pSer/pThr/pTyr-binding forkhead associated (FHA) protein